MSVSVCAYVLMCVADGFGGGGMGGLGADMGGGGFAADVGGI